MILLLALVLGVTRAELVVLILTITIVLTAEMINTAISGKYSKFLNLPWAFLKIFQKIS